MTPCRAFAFLVVAACLVAAKQVNGSPGLMHKRTDGRLPPRPGTSKPPPRRQPAVVYPNLDAAVRENVIDVDGGLVAFTSGTSTMVPLMANMWETIARLRHPFPVVAYGLDESSKAALRDVPFGRSVAEDLPEFVGTSPVNFTSGILFGSQQFKHVTRFKMILADAVLKRFAQQRLNVLVLDPDLVFFRNPLRYLESLPECDMYFQGEVAAWRLLDFGVKPEMLGDARFLSALGNPEKMPLYNTGFMSIRNNPSSEMLLRDLLSYMHARDQMSPKLGCDDQCMLNTLFYAIDDVYHYVPPPGYEHIPGNATQAETEQARMHSLASGQCIEYKRTIPDINGVDRVKVWVLNPALFPLRPIYEHSRMHQVALEPPFMVHYNWIHGVKPKETRMQENGHWYTDFLAGAP